MFVTNSQLLHKITTLEDKINNINISNECCKCKLIDRLKEYLDVKLIDQLKEYLDVKLIDIINNSKTDQLDNNQKYNNEILNVIKTLKDEIKNKSKDETKVETKDEFMYKEIKNISLQIELITEKMGSLYFENEIFKHQLSLEEDIRKSIDEINTITNIINNSVYEIDLLVKKIE